MWEKWCELRHLFLATFGRSTSFWRHNLRNLESFAFIYFRWYGWFLKSRLLLLLFTTTKGSHYFFLLFDPFYLGLKQISYRWKNEIIRSEDDRFHDRLIVIAKKKLTSESMYRYIVISASYLISGIHTKAIEQPCDVWYSITHREEDATKIVRTPRRAGI